jgi:hypothetical protein
MEDSAAREVSFSCTMQIFIRRYFFASGLPTISSHSNKNIEYPLNFLAENGNYYDVYTGWASGVLATYILYFAY